MNLTAWMPFWNSLDAVRLIHSSLELSSILFFLLLALFDALAHWTKNKDREHTFGAIGIVFFFIAVICEFAGYAYGQRSDTLSEKVIVSLDIKAQHASDASATAQTKAEGANATADTAIAKLGILSDRIDEASGKMGEIENDVSLQGPRFALLDKNRAKFIRVLRPFAGTKITIAECISDEPANGELLRTNVELFHMLGKPYPVGAGWNALGDRWKCTLGGTLMSVSPKASPKTLAAAKALNDELNKIHIHMETIPTEPKILHGPLFPYPVPPEVIAMRDEDNPERIFLVLAEHNLADAPFPKEPTIKGAAPPHAR